MGAKLTPSSCGALSAASVDILCLPVGYINQRTDRSASEARIISQVPNIIADFLRK